MTPRRAPAAVIVQLLADAADACHLSPLTLLVNPGHVTVYRGEPGPQLTTHQARCLLREAGCDLHALTRSGALLTAPAHIDGTTLSINVSIGAPK